MRRQLHRSPTARALLAAAAFATVAAPLQSCIGASQGHASVSAPRPSYATAAEAVAPVEVTLRNQLGERGVFVLPHDGVLDRAAAKQMARFFRCRRSGRRHRIAPGVLAMLYQIAREFPGREIEIVSAYRRPPYASRTSRHAHGRAIDLRVDGVRARVVRDFVWNLYGGEEAGVGFYIEQGFVHIDHREGESIAWTQRNQGDPYRYDPPWSRKRDRDRDRDAEVAMADE